MHTIPFYLFWFNTDDQPIAVLSTVLPFLNLPGPQKRGIEGGGEEGRGIIQE